MKDGILGVLLKEAESIQKYIKTTNATSIICEISKKVSRKMRRGNVHHAIKLLTDNMKKGILSLTEKILQY